MIEPNQPAPDFALPDQDGEVRRLADYRGRRVILYFYPKDDTSGCTTQACELRDRIEEIDAGNAVVLGVSPDPVKSHRRFADKYDLPFTLLADEDHTLAEAYGVWKEKSMYGRTFWGNERTTFIIDEEGRIAHVLPKVKPAQHADRVLEKIR
jgi:thioredoxin-dependent peroxiredoxin